MIATEGGIGLKDDTFARLIERLRGGDDAAVEQLLDEYSDAIGREVRFSLLDDRLRRLVSESDVCQSVITRLVIGLWAGKYEFESPGDLLALLKTMVRSRVADHARYWQAQRRDLRRNLAIDSNIDRTLSTDGETPSQIAAKNELLARFREQLSEEELQIMSMRQERFSWGEIAEKLEGGATPEAIRKRYERAVARVCSDLGIDG